MPYISIKSDYLMENINVGKINKGICQALQVHPSRIKISWEIFHQDLFYNHPNEGEPDEDLRLHRPIVQIAVSKRNPRSFVEALVKATVHEVCDVLGTKEDKVMVLIHNLDEGDIFLNGTYI